jgi:hypothetical protein
MNFKRIITLTSFFGLAACGSTESRTVEGQLATGARSAGRAEVVATSAQGLEVVGRVGDDGRFSLELPLGSYAVAFRAPLEGSGRVVHFAHLVGRGSSAPRGVMRVEAGDDHIDLGTLTRSDDAASHDVGDDHGVDNPATHDVGDDHGVDNPATHDVGDDHGVDNPATHDVGDDHGHMCQAMDPATGTAATVLSFLVVPSVERPFDDNPHSGGGALEDRDLDGRADRHDDDRNEDGLCDDDVGDDNGVDGLCDDDVGDDNGVDDPATHDVGDDNGVDDPATHDVGDDNGVDDPATHDVGDDNGGATGGTDDTGTDDNGGATGGTDDTGADDNGGATGGTDDTGADDNGGNGGGGGGGGDDTGADDNGGGR